VYKARSSILREISSLKKVVKNRSERWGERNGWQNPKNPQNKYGDIWTRRIEVYGRRDD
jgi:hypothetical protein